MSEVLFVVPAFRPKFTEECRGTLLLATILREQGIDVDIYRFFESSPENGFNYFVETSAKNILAKSPKIVSFYCRGDCYLANIMTAKKLKELNPYIYIVFGGPQADVSAKDTIEQIPWVDYCCSGEGESTVYPLFNGLLKGEDVTSIKGLTYRDEKGNVFSNPRPDPNYDLDALPFIDYSFLPEFLLNSIKENNTHMEIDVGRGCPFNCAYCSTSLFWQRRFRLKSSDRIIEEMKQLNNMLGTTLFCFEHDLFTANKKQVYDFCRTLRESDLNVKWTCSSRADTIDKDLIEEMAKSGLRAIFLGIESGSPRMQKLMHKKLDIEKTVEVVKHLTENNVNVTASFMYGFPEETFEDVDQTLQMVYRLYKFRISAFQFHLCSIFPGTEYFSVYKDKMVWAETVSDHVGDFGVKECTEFIRNHKDVFPYYYEYKSELRTRLNGFKKTALLFIALYDQLIKLDPNRISDLRMIDLYLDYSDSNTELINKMESYNECKEHEIEFRNNFLHYIYDEEQAETLIEAIDLKKALQAVNKEEGDTSLVKICNVDADAVLKKKTLSEIKRIPTILYINKVNDKITYRVQYLG